MRWLLALLAGTARADDACPALTVTMVPSEDLQIVAWLEDAAGNYVDTIFITQATGLYGIGNRAGRFGIKSGPLWPYGKRLDVFPIWAHRHGHVFPMVTWQNPDLEPVQLVNAFSMSSREDYFCRPLMTDEPAWDTGTCASPVVLTDKGKYSAVTIGYPPRSDHARAIGDHANVDDYPTMNPFDTVSRATPLGGEPFTVGWLLPEDLPDGDYVVRLEVSKEFDKNASYNDQTLPTPVIAFGAYGLPYRGQPSVIYDVPIAITATSGSARTATYAGYGDPDGLDGNVRAPDDTIDVDVPGSGAARLLLAPAAAPYRVRVDFERDGDRIAPGAIADPRATAGSTSATISFVATGDDGSLGTVKGYEVRYRIGALDEASFDSATRADDIVAVVPAGELQTFELTHLRSQTPYSVGIRAYDDCMRYGPIVVLSFDTERLEGEVAGCCETGRSASALLALLVLGVLRRRRVKPTG